MNYKEFIIQLSLKSFLTSLSKNECKFILVKASAILEKHYPRQPTKSVKRYNKVVLLFHFYNKVK